MRNALVRVTLTPAGGGTPITVEALLNATAQTFGPDWGVRPCASCPDINPPFNPFNAPLASMPDVPGLKERGLDAEYAQWSGLFVAQATPEPIAQRLRAAARFAAQDAKVRDVINNAGSPVLYQDATEFEKYVQADARRMVDVVKRIGKLE